MLQEEFEHGEKVCTRILSEGTPTKWHQLFEPVPFFRNYKNYLQACCCLDSLMPICQIVLSGSCCSPVKVLLNCLILLGSL